MMSNIYISTVCASMGNYKFLDLFLRSFFSYTDNLTSNEICVHLDGAEDFKSLSVLEYYFNRYPNIKFSVAPHRGISYATNQAIALAEGEYINWAADDFVFMPHWDTRLQKYLHPDHYVSFDMVEPTKGCFPPAVYIGEHPDQFDEKKYLSALSNRANIIKSELGFVFGNGVVHKSCIQKSGGFDILFDPYGGNDSDYLYQLFLKNPNLIFFKVKDISYYHFQRGAIKHNPDRNHEQAWERFLSKHGLTIHEAERKIHIKSLGQRQVLKSKGILLDDYIRQGREKLPGDTLI